jgi:hypothetical protein
MSKRTSFVTVENRFYALIPTAAFIRSSGRLAANVAGTWPFGRRLFLEADALAFIQLIEAALHRAPMKKPLLSPVVADETETPVTNESLDRAARHPSLLWARDAQALIINFRSTLQWFEKTAGFAAESAASAVRQHETPAPVYNSSPKERHL